MSSSIQATHGLTFPPLEAEHVQWVRDHLSLIAIGGCWIIPRTTTIVTRETETTVSIMGPESDPDSPLVAYLKAAGQTIVASA